MTQLHEMNADEKTLVKAFKTALVIGPHPSHKHVCGCECNSPYCEDVNFIPCQNHGGPPRVHKGLEPWRGR